MNSVEFAKSIIEGPGGMNSFEEHEIPAWEHSERVEAVLWTLRCLANPDCEGSAEALEAIRAKRSQLEGQFTLIEELLGPDCAALAKRRSAGA